MKLRKRKKGGRKEYYCAKCGAVHLYHFMKCSWCGKKNHIPKPLKKKAKRVSKRWEKEIKQVARLAAVVASCKSCKSKKAKKDILYESFQEHPFLIKLFRYAYDPNFVMGFDLNFLDQVKAEYGIGLWTTLKDRCIHKGGKQLAAGRWIGILDRHEKEFHPVLEGFLDGTFWLGMNVNGINKVLRKLGEEPIRKKKERK